MKKKATTRAAEAASRQSTLNFPTSSEAELVAESTAAETTVKSQAKNRRKRTADFADTINSPAIESKAVDLARDTLWEFPTGETLLMQLLQIRRNSWKGRGKYKEPVAPDTSNLPTLPKGWTWASADQLTTMITDGEHITPERAESGIFLLSARNVLDGRICLDDVDYVPQHEYDRIAKRLVVECGDVLLSCSGSVGRTAVVPDGLLFTLVRSVAVLKPMAKMGKYLSTALRSPLLKQQITEKQTQTAQANIFQGKIKALCIPLPPLPEQHRIVAEIEKQFTRLDAGVAALKRVQANLKRYRAAVLKAACEGKLVPTEAELRRTADYADIANKKMRPSASSAKSAVKTPPFETGEQLLQRILTKRRQNWQGRGQYKEPDAPYADNLTPLPEGWTWASVAQVSSSIVDCPHSTAKFVTVGLPCVDTTCIKPGMIVREKLRFVSRETFEQRVERLVPAADDIVFAREGTVGTAVAIPDDVNPCLGQRVMLMRPDSCIVPRYFQHCLNSQIIRQQYLPKIVGSTAPHINVAAVKLFALPLPPLAEQTRIVAEVERRLSVVDELEAVVSANLQRSARLRQSILQKAFTGELV